MVGGNSGWISWVSSAAGCVSGVFCTKGSGADGLGTDVSRFGKGSGLVSGGGDGEWSGVIGVVGILSVGSSTCGGESSGLSENRLLINWLISSKLYSSTSLTGSLANGECGMSKGIKDEVRLATT